MTSKLILFFTVILALIFLLAGWFGYDWLFRLVTADLSQSVVAVSPDAVLHQRLLVSLSFAIVGIAMGFGVWLTGRASTRNHDAGHSILLIAVAIAALITMIQLQSQNIKGLSENLKGPTGELHASISLSSIHLYQIGLIASACVLFASIVLALLYKARSNK